MTRNHVSMVTESFHRVITGKMVLPLFSAVLHPILFILAGNQDMHEISNVFEIRLTAELAALERLKKSP